MNEDRTNLIASILTSTEAVNPIEVSGNLRLSPQRQLGIPYYALFDNPNVPQEQSFRQYVLNVMNDPNSLFTTTLTINKSILEDNEIFSAIRDRILTDKTVKAIRIADDGYTLTQEDYQKLSFDPNIRIFVDNCVEELKNDTRIELQNGVFKRDIQNAQPVLERRQNFNDLEERYAFHINHRLTEEEFEELAQAINKQNNPSIELDYFEPEYYEEFLKGLQRHHVKDNINIQFVGYLLEDKSNTYRSLAKYPYEIDIVYSTCHDMVEQYTKEPYVENRMYYSQIEGGGKTSLDNYANVVKNLEDFQLLVEGNDLSPLESAVLAKMRIDNEYIYDPDVDFADEWDNINLSQMLNHEVNGQKRAVCMGFSTYYSAMLRRVGVPMFRYSTTGHSRNIGRIKDDKYGVDNICASDLTWDLQSENANMPTYTYFMNAPRDYMGLDSSEHMTIADALSLPIHEYYGNVDSTRLPYEAFYHPIGYDPMGYAATVLRLAGEVPQEQKTLDVYDKIYSLTEQGRFEGIPQETIMAAVNNTLQAIGVDMFDRISYNSYAETSFASRQSTFGYPHAIRENDPQKVHDVHALTPENVGFYRQALKDSGVQPPIYGRSYDDLAAQTQENTPVTDVAVPEVTTQALVPVDQNQVVQDADYVHKVLAYCNTNQMSIYNYYRNIGRAFHNEEFDPIPEFERENPFLTQDDPERVASSEDGMIVHYFADAMMQTIGLNLSNEEREQYQNLFSAREDTYLSALNEEMDQIIHETVERVHENEERVVEHPEPTFDYFATPPVAPETHEPTPDRPPVEPDMSFYDHPVGADPNAPKPEPTFDYFATPTERPPVESEERRDVAERITIYVDENNQPYINRYACTRFLAVPSGESIIIDGRVFFPVEREDAQAIIDAQEASVSPYFTEVLPFTLHPVKQNEEQVTEEEHINPEENTPKVEENNNQEEIVIDDPVTQELGEFSEDLIPGTDIHRPRRRGDYETDEEYVEFLRRFYQKYFPNAEYVQNVIHYCQENETNIYDYYQEVANGYRGENAENLPEFERENPFISEGDINLLLTSDDSMIDTHFANAMMGVIGLNISDFQRNKLSDMFDNPEDRYNEELARQYH